MSVPQIQITDTLRNVSVRIGSSLDYKAKIRPDLKAGGTLKREMTAKMTPDGLKIDFKV